MCEVTISQCLQQRILRVLENIDLLLVTLSYPWKDVEEEEKSIFEGKRELEGGWRRATRF